MSKLPEVEINYFPHKGQMPFHKDRYKVRNRGLIGGGSTGKTEAGAYESLAWMVDNPGCVGGVFAPSYKMVNRNIIPKFEKLLGVSDIEQSPFVDSFHKTNMVLTFNTFTKNHRLKQSKLWLVGLERPEAAEGMNLDFAYLDEARLVPKFEPALRSIMRRLRGSGMALPFDRGRVPDGATGMWVTTTPDAPGSDLYNFFEHPKKKNPESAVYRMELDDNAKNLDENYMAEMKRTHSGGLYDRFIKGLFAAIEAGSFGFDPLIHVVEKNVVDGKVYLAGRDNMPFFPLDALLEQRVVYGVDFGWTNPSAIVAVVLDGDDRALVLDEFYGGQMSPQALVNECLLMQSKYGRGTFWCDSSRPDNIAIMSREGLDARANKSKRDDGIAELGGRFQDAGDGLRRVYIASECVNLVEELPIFDPERKEFDHATDALRYAVMGGKVGGGAIQVLTGRRPR